MINIIIVSLILIVVLVINFTTIRPYLQTKNELKNKEILNTQQRLLAEMSPELIETTLNTYIEKYVDKYILYNFTAKKIPYIKQDLIDEMIKSITKDISLNMSELYVFYLRMLRPIESDDDFITNIYDLVMNTTILKVSDYNAQIE